ncbi:hypothetical protein GCM10011392_08370 [Wenxinia marina]|nr:hypothetical protein GCM10011392_08370 [Wenxinia marina]
MSGIEIDVRQQQEVRPHLGDDAEDGVQLRIVAVHEVAEQEAGTVPVERCREDGGTKQLGRGGTTGGESREEKQKAYGQPLQA